MNLNLDSTPSPFPIQHQIGTDNIDMSFCSINSSSSSSLSCHFFFNSTHDSNMRYCHDDQPGLFQPQHIKDENQGIYNHVGSKYEMKNNKVHPSGFKLTLWKNDNLEERDNNHPVKWMSSKMTLMHKIKNNPRRVTLKMAKNKLENETSSFESDDSSGIGSYTNNNGSVRVCSDCNTTKTPLWRSGPKGPKSLCNACGIRQRKARRAMAAAAAAAASDHQNGAPTKIKAQHDEGKNVNFKKRCKTSTSEAGSQSDGRKKIGFEDFLINLSKNLSFHHVFPEDEKDAAILLMALSSGLVHG